MNIIARITVKPLKTNARRNAKCIMVIERPLQNPPQKLSIVDFPYMVFVAGPFELSDDSSSKFFKTQSAALMFAEAESRTFN